MTEIGWKFISWSGAAHPCNVGACARMVTSGNVRVDAQDHNHPDFKVICTNCWFKIRELGIDPDPDATTPTWEIERRKNAESP